MAAWSSNCPASFATIATHTVTLAGQNFHRALAQLVCQKIVVFVAENNPQNHASFVPNTIGCIPFLFPRRMQFYSTLSMSLSGPASRSKVERIDASP